MEDRLTDRTMSSFGEGIDISKLRSIVRSRWIWIALFFIFVNLSAYLITRYSKSIYESESVLKLDQKSDATELGIQKIVEDQNANLISGEIELIQSRLFLRRVIDSLGIGVTYFSRGEVLDFELYRNAPFEVSTRVTDASWYNTPIVLKPLGNQRFSLFVGARGVTIEGVFGKLIGLPGATLLIREADRDFEGNITYVFILNSPESIVDYLAAHLTVEPLDLNANTIRVSFNDNNPYKARDMVNKIDSLYLQFSNEQKNLANTQKIQWLANELGQIENKMEGYEQYFEDFTLQNRTNNLDNDLRETVGRINQIDSQRYELSARLTNIGNLHSQLAGDNYRLDLSQRNYLPAHLMANLEKMQTLATESQRLRLAYNENTYAVQSRETGLRTLKQDAITELESLRSVWSRRLSALNIQKAKLENQFANIPDKKTQLNKNQRYYKLYEELYLSLMQTKSGFEITQAGSTPDFKILSPGSMPGAPISPQRSLIIAVGIVASLVLNVFFIGALYLLNNKITSVNELERHVAIPVLGVVPSSRRIDPGTPQIVNAPRSMVSESFRTLRTNLGFFSPRDESKVIAVSSTVSGEGKSFVAMNLGAVMAASRKRVALIDLDMRKRPANGTADNERGMSTILIGRHSWGECIRQSSVEWMDFIPSGPLPPNPSELLMNGAFNNVLNDLRSHYDYIILDTPPVGIVTDGIMAMKQADLTIYVFRANYSKKEFLQTVRRLISINKLSNIATLLNALPPTSERRYGYGYYDDNNGEGLLKSLFKKS